MSFLYATPRTRTFAPFTAFPSSLSAHATFSTTKSGIAEFTSLASDKDREKARKARDKAKENFEDEWRKAEKKGNLMASMPDIRDVFETTKTMSTYITALVAGEYHGVTDVYSGDYGDIPLGVWCRQSLVEHLDADDILLVTKQGFAFFEDAFQMAYPFVKYDQLFVPEYNMGAMENAGCVTFRDEMIFRSRQTVAAYEQRANTILHEMAHMWFGDLVTMKWWDDLWLNESFAEFAAHHSSVEATRFTDAWTGFTNNRKNWAYRQDQLPSTHPIAADNYDLHAVEAAFLARRHETTVLQPVDDKLLMLVQHPWRGRRNGDG